MAILLCSFENRVVRDEIADVVRVRLGEIFVSHRLSGLPLRIKAGHSEDSWYELEIGKREMLQTEG